MRAAMLVVGLMLWASASTAAPGVIVAPGTTANVAPSDAARTIAQLDAGVAVCVLSYDASYAGTLYRRPGWLAIQLPDGNVGYVRIEAVDVSATPAVDPGCSQPAGPTTRISPHLSQRPDAPASEPLPTAPLLAGGFLPLHPMRFVFGMGLGAMSVRDQAAEAQQIGNTGFLLDFSGGLLLSDIFMISGSFGVSAPSDNDMFTQSVMPVNGGDTTTASSQVTVFRYSFALGVHTPFWAMGHTSNGWIAGAVFANFGWAGVSANRTISNCSDCRNDTLTLLGGSFWRAGVELAIPTHSPKVAWGFTASYQSYRGDSSLSQEFLVGANFWLL